jgi:transposase-like protein
VFTENQEVVIRVPRDRNGTFEPQIVPKGRKRVPLFKDRILSMYSFGMRNRDIQSRLEQVYNVEVSPELISQVTDTVMEDTREWLSRPLEKSCTIVYPNAPRGEQPEGREKLSKERVCGPGGEFRGEKRGFRDMDIGKRRTEDIPIACMDRLAGFSDAVRVVFPERRIQRCIVYMARNSELKAIYPEQFGEKRLAKYPPIYKSWDTNRPEFCEFLMLFSRSGCTRGFSTFLTLKGGILNPLGTNKQTCPRLRTPSSPWW